MGERVRCVWHEYYFFNRERGETKVRSDTLKDQEQELCLLLFAIKKKKKKIKTSRKFNDSRDSPPKSRYERTTILDILLVDFNVPFNLPEIDGSRLKKFDALKK